MAEIAVPLKCPYLSGGYFMPLQQLRSLFKQTTLVNPAAPATCVVEGASLDNDLIGKSHLGPQFLGNEKAVHTFL